MFPRFFQLLLVCLLALTAWSAANAHTRIQNAVVGDGLAVMVEAGEERDATEDPQDDGDSQTQVDTQPADDIPCSPKHGRCWRGIHLLGTRITRRQITNAT